MKREQEIGKLGIEGVDGNGVKRIMGEVKEEMEGKQNWGLQKLKEVLVRRKGRRLKEKY